MAGEGSERSSGEDTSAQGQCECPYPTGTVYAISQWGVSESAVAIPNKRTKVSKRTIALIVLLLGAAVQTGIGVGIWYFLSGKNQQDSSKVGVHYLGSLHIQNEDFISEYGQKGSQEFKKKASDINDEIKKAISSSDFQSYYNKSVVFTFGKGSLLAYFWMDFRTTEKEKQEISTELVRTSISKFFEAQGSTDYQVLANSTEVTRVSRKDLKTLAFAAECHQYVFVDSSHSIRLEGPDSNFKSCFWHLQGLAGQLLRLRLEWVKSDCRDRILVFDEATAARHNLLTSLYRCNWQEPAVEVVSSSNVMSIIWKEGRYSNDDTFTLSAQVLPKTECFANITLREEWGIQGYRSTPYFPSYYPPNAHCTWFFTIPSLDYGITLWFDGYELDTPPFTKLCRQGQWTVQNRNLCGRRVLQPYAERIFAVALTTKVTFSSKVTLTGPGIQFHYSLFNQSHPCPDGVLCLVSGLCVPECDGLKDCSNNADESNCVCPAQHQCTGESSSCLSLHKVCNLVNECETGTDEQHCDGAVPCTPFTYQCADGSCVKKANPQCDYENDCLDSSDEQNCDCGLQISKSRIVGGTNSTEGEWPWQVSLQAYSRHICGGILINERWVLSAAHCFPSSKAPPEQWTIKLGKFKLNTVGKNELSFKALRIIVHPYYDQETSDYDVALLELDQRVPVMPTSFPICLPATSHVFEAGLLCWVTGWGTTEEEGSLSDVLQKVDVRLVDQSTCDEAYTDISSRMLCAGYAEGEKDSCQGDSGGPLVCEETSGRWFLAGIVSFGYGCGRPDYYGVYTRVTRVVRWIHTIAW
ncbi:LOW QUALITY PROTEIN: transmembrane protease serine 6 [Leucoraja erinacea]|uniref:LOW QUALITY PROTEIN: transmembrane protease serine 6 n=1 Tax=Leucoraja erinaceus TaxID=7782 RepID=UPI002453762A|nr:LOW QUALITY PROTEIN: transmembrane protease serine 6 [Leucoraja erinacea]